MWMFVNSQLLVWAKDDALISPQPGWHSKSSKCYWPEFFRVLSGNFEYQNIRLKYSSGLMENSRLNVIVVSWLHCIYILVYSINYVLWDIEMKTWNDLLKNTFDLLRSPDSPSIRSNEKTVSFYSGPVYIWPCTPPLLSCLNTHSANAGKKQPNRYIAN